MAKLAKNVYVRGHGWFGPAYPDAGNPPSGLITNPQCWEGGDTTSAPSAAEQAPASPAADPGEDDGPPPKSGRGSSDANWTAYARRQNVTVDDAMSRAEVIAACEKAGVPTE